MMYLKINTTLRVKKNLDALINNIRAEKWDDAKKLIDEVKADVIKHYSTSNMTWEEPVKILDDMAFFLDRFRIIKWRQDKEYLLFKSLIGVLRSFSEDATLKEKLLYLYNGMQDNFNYLCETGNPECMEALRGQETELYEYASQVRKKGDLVNQYYKQAQSNLSRCLTLLPKLQIKLDDSGKVIGWKRDEASKIADNFSTFFSDLKNILTALDEPVIKQKVPQTVAPKYVAAEDELDELKEQAERDRYYRLLTAEDLKPSEIANLEHTTVDHVNELLFP